jgi:hypothetical protein
MIMFFTSIIMGGSYAVATYSILDEQIKLSPYPYGFISVINFKKNYFLKIK